MIMMRRDCALVLFCCLSLSTPAFAQGHRFYPRQITYRQSIPRLEQVVGHDWGEDITSYQEMEQYLKALADASPRVQLVPYGKTWEGRTLFYLILASESNLARLEEIQSGLKQLADPRTTTEAQAQLLIQRLPVVVWLAYAVHGNEISGTDAALLTAYHLAAAQDDPLANVTINNCIVIIDPLQNPDGRDRFISFYRQTRGRWPDPDPQSAEHHENWPTGRTNHYLFDLNRDWFAQTQPETRARVRAYRQWMPQVFVDLHEMNPNGTYYFPPQAQPRNPQLTDSLMTWLSTFGRHNARWFDRLRLDYFTGEIYDSFYPGYGASWPLLQGAIGMTYEQASVQGLVRERTDSTTIHYRDSVQHHFIASLSTTETAALRRQALLRHFYQLRAAATEEGKHGTIKEYIIVPGKDPNRAAKLVALLMAQGIEVKRAVAAFTNSRAQDYYGGEAKSKEFPGGTYIISAAQPASHLLRTLMDKETPMNRAFVKEQERRVQKRLPPQIYDMTGWSLPLLYDLECYRAAEVSQGSFEVLSTSPAVAGRLHGGEAGVAYVIPWGTNAAARALARLLRDGVRIHSSDKPFTLGARAFPAGSLIVKVRNNPGDLHQRLTRLAGQVGVEIFATNTSWVEAGVNLGSRQVHFLHRPRIALAYGPPTRPSSVGWTRYLLEEVYDYPVTIILAQRLRRADLSKYNVIILPDLSPVSATGSAGILGTAGAQHLKRWVQGGGTLIALGQAVRWLTHEKVVLLSTSRELKHGRPNKRSQPGTRSGQAKSRPARLKPAGAFKLDAAIRPQRELPTPIPGAILRVRFDREHWLAHGTDGEANVVVRSGNIFTPLRLDKGRNVGLYMEADKVLVSGFAWEETRKQIAQKAYLMDQPHGRGHVIAFAEDPNFRAFTDGLNLLFLNAVFFGPSH